MKYLRKFNETTYEDVFGNSFDRSEIFNCLSSLMLKYELDDLTEGLSDSTFETDNSNLSIVVNEDFFREIRRVISKLKQVRSNNGSMFYDPSKITMQLFVNSSDESQTVFTNLSDVVKDLEDGKYINYNITSLYIRLVTTIHN
jgi:hypothetical protein